MRFLLLCLFVALSLPIWAQLPQVRIGTLADGPSPYLRELRDQIEKEMADLMSDEFTLLFPEEAQLQGDWSTALLETQLSDLLMDSEVDLILTIGVVSSHVALLRGDLNKPVIATAVLESQIPYDHRYVEKLAYVNSPVDMVRDLTSFRELVHFQNLAVLVDQELYTQLHFDPRLFEPLARQWEIEITTIPVASDPAEALNLIGPQVDAVYITPLFRAEAAEFQDLVKGLIARGLPSFSMLGEDEVAQGVLYGLAPGSDMPRLARRIALNTQRVLLGEEPASIPTDMGLTSRLSFNRATAAAIGYSPPWMVLTDAQIFGHLPEGASFSLCSALNWVLSVNPQVLAARQRVRAGCGEIGEARSRLLPQVGLGLTARQIDQARAREGLGRTPQRMVEGEVVVEQVLWSDRRWAAYDIQRYLQCGRSAELREVILDVLFEVGQAYVDLLRDRTLLQIEQQNLELTRNNLRYAQSRVDIGTARRNEVYRWEAQLARNKESVVLAQARVRIREADLNRVMHRGTTCPIYTDEQTLDELMKAIDQNELSHLISTPQLFDWFTQFEVEQGWRAAPELDRIESAMKAQWRRLCSDKRAFYSPDIGFRGETQQRFVRGGVGVNPPELPFPFDTFLGTKGQVNDWAVALQASFPLFEGGAKCARLSRDRALLCELGEEWQRVADLISQRVSVALDRGLASFLSIDLAAEAVLAADKNLDFVEEAYAKGAASILDLLDAQETRLEAVRSSADAQFNFAVDLLRLSRAVGRFDYLCSDCERRRWYGALRAFLQHKKEQQPCAVQR